MHEVLAIKRVSNAIGYGEDPESVRPTPTNILATISLINSDADIWRRLEPANDLSQQVKKKGDRSAINWRILSTTSNYQKLPPSNKINHQCHSATVIGFLSETTEKIRFKRQQAQLSVRLTAQLAIHQAWTPTPSLRASAAVSWTSATFHASGRRLRTSCRGISWWIHPRVLQLFFWGGNFFKHGTFETSNSHWVIDLFFCAYCELDTNIRFLARKGTADAFLTVSQTPNAPRYFFNGALLASKRHRFN